MDFVDRMTGNAGTQRFTPDSLLKFTPLCALTAFCHASSSWIYIKSSLTALQRLMQQRSPMFLGVGVPSIPQGLDPL